MAWKLSRLPREALPDLSHAKGLPSGMPSPDVIAKDLAAAPNPAEMSILFVDPIVAFTGSWMMAGADAQRADAALAWQRGQVWDLVAPSRVVWANADVSRPVLALIKRTEIFVVSFAYEDRFGAYIPQQGRRLVRPPARAWSKEPQTTPAEAAWITFTEAVERRAASNPLPAEMTFPQRMKAASTVASEEAERWLAPAAGVLRQRAACDFLQLPSTSQPAEPDWVRADASRNATALLSAGATFTPAAAWRPHLFVAPLLSAMSTERSADLAARGGLMGLMTALAPPQLMRINDDPNEPKFFMADDERAVVVTAHFDVKARRYSVRNAQWFERRAPSQPARNVKSAK